MNTRLVASFLLVFCGVSVWQLFKIPESTMYSEVGPVLAPSVLVGLLTLLAVFYVFSAFQNKAPDCINIAESQPLPGSIKRVFYLLSGGVVFIIGAKILGFLIPAALCGLGVAMAFDAKFSLRSLTVVFAIAAVFWGIFSPLLGVDLGPLIQIHF